MLSSLTDCFNRGVWRTDKELHHIEQEQQQHNNNHLKLKIRKTNGLVVDYNALNMDGLKKKDSKKNSKKFFCAFIFVNYPFKLESYFGNMTVKLMALSWHSLSLLLTPGIDIRVIHLLSSLTSSLLTRSLSQWGCRCDWMDCIWLWFPCCLGHCHG